ncbi:MAG TPA: hypothetical protein DDX47_00620 [Candidatus Jacksonbacteria bacterium]|nr:hypothetical protein [Candidatus Jacksonbacteria bacterium]HCC50436.1 hypothetical protein [Candidatus Jacksonbacteria bacterium]HCE48773.1 hypothetical protein [Candidatus Jacksonbacteria bacterium]HCR15436.1 hypothetical protein [Candidatus Jacksonbacteria bacterium]
MSEKLERLSKLFDLPANRRMIAELGEAHIKLVKKYSFQPMLRQHLKRLIKGSLIYGVGGFFTKFISILILPLFTFYLTPKDYGVMSMLNFLVIFLSTLFSFGLGTAIGICYFDQKDEKHKNQTISQAFIILFFGSLLMLILGIIFIEPINRILFPLDNYKKLIILTLVGTAFTNILTPFILKLQFEENQKRFIILSAVSTFTAALLSILFVILFKKGIAGMVEAKLISNILSFLIFLIPAIQVISLKVNLLGIKNLFRHGLPMIPSFFALYILQQGNFYILAHQHNALDAVGLYAIAVSFASPMLLLVSAFQTAWLPFFLSFSQKQQEAQVLISRVMKYYVLFGGLISLLFYLFAKPMFALLVNPNFYIAYPVVGLIATAYLLIGIFSILLPSMYYAKEVKYVTYIQTLTATLFVFMSFLLTLKLGIIGAGIALIFGYLLMDILLILWNKLRFRQHKYLPIIYAWRQLLTFIGMYILFVIIIFKLHRFSKSTELIYSFTMFSLILMLSIFLLSKTERNVFINAIKIKWNSIIISKKTL